MFLQLTSLFSGEMSSEAYPQALHWHCGWDMWGNRPCPGFRSRASSGLVALSGLELALWGLGLTLSSFGPAGQGCGLALQGFLSKLAGSKLQLLCGVSFSRAHRVFLGAHRSVHFITRQSLAFTSGCSEWDASV